MHPPPPFPSFIALASCGTARYANRSVLLSQRFAWVQLSSRLAVPSQRLIRNLRRLLHWKFRQSRQLVPSSNLITQYPISRLLTMQRLSATHDF